MYLDYNKNYKDIARKLRNNMTQEERKLWYLCLRWSEYRFLRQKTIDNYIVDFYCPRRKLVIELDGSQHYTKLGEEYDENRTKKLKFYGLKILRFSNYEINYRFKNVCEAIYIELNNPQSAKADSPLK